VNQIRGVARTPSQRERLNEIAVRGNDFSGTQSH
jgi:hypothetical protein